VDWLDEKEKTLSAHIKVRLSYSCISWDFIGRGEDRIWGPRSVPHMSITASFV
jgi:hypothetical protein